MVLYYNTRNTVKDLNNQNIYTLKCCSHEQSIPEISQWNS